MKPLSCPTCDVPLTSSEADSGWCPSCGKRLPTRIVEEGTKRLVLSGKRSSTGRSPVAPRQTDRDHLPGLARVARWMIRLSAAGLIFLVAGCCGITTLVAYVLPAGNSAAESDKIYHAIGTGLGMMFIVLFVTLLVGYGLKVLAGDYRE
jgi:hypothetical protein